jgi:hypothetical protein
MGNNPKCGLKYGNRDEDCLNKPVIHRCSDCYMVEKNTKIIDMKLFPCQCCERWIFSQQLICKICMIRTCNYCVRKHIKDHLN